MKSLADIAAAERLISPARLASAELRASATGEALVAILVEVEHVSEADLAEALARHLCEPIRTLPDFEEQAICEVPHDIARGRRVVPLSTEISADGTRVLRVAMADPTDRETVEELEQIAAARVEPTLALLSEVDEALRRAYQSFVPPIVRRGPVQPGMRRAPFGSGLMPSTDAPGRPEEVRARLDRRAEEEAPLELRHCALLETLIARGIITHEDYARELLRLLSDHD
jgi:hypothetical protein